MKTIEVRVVLNWTDSRPITLDDQGCLVVGDLPTEPAVYRWMLTGAGRDRPAVYIGEGENLRTRIRNYRRPSKMPTAGALHHTFVEHLRAGGQITLDSSTSAYVTPNRTAAPLSRRTLRRLVEGAVIAVELAAGTAELLNRDRETE